MLYSGEPSVVYKGVGVKPEALREVISLEQNGQFADAQELVRKTSLAGFINLINHSATCSSKPISKGR